MVVEEEEESCGLTDFSALVYPGCIIACWAYSTRYLALGKLLKNLNGKHPINTPSMTVGMPYLDRTYLYWYIDLCNTNLPDELNISGTKSFDVFWSFGESSLRLLYSKGMAGKFSNCHKRCKFIDLKSVPNCTQLQTSKSMWRTAVWFHVCYLYYWWS